MPDLYRGASDANHMTVRSVIHAFPQIEADVFPEFPVYYVQETTDEAIQTTGIKHLW